eukprot:10281423-Ditylum_brightwellii.AAC.1
MQHRYQTHVNRQYNLHRASRKCKPVRKIIDILSALLAAAQKLSNAKPDMMSFQYHLWHIMDLAALTNGEVDELYPLVLATGISAICHVLTHMNEYKIFTSIICLPHTLNS